MTFIEAIKSYFKKYATFNGRASRSEFWFVVLFTALVSMAISIIAPGHTQMMGNWDVQQNSPLSSLWSLATFVPSLAITWRRLHDVNKSGAWFFFVLLPIVGWILLLIQLVKDSDAAANQYGEALK
ncbi:DUF805 domain-containing protein [Rhodoluna sp.]|uniref:DUF805 domain-containing protein n=1 Tax=Rhodoluna sp. TaxID=1969481 RepID=UPI0025F6617F|nr:DUF805 domain-containing protein [Rhodoluna sp.]